MDKNQEDVLVVGDWYVDAHWVVEPNHSELASRSGDAHTVATHSLDSTVEALGGAGLVARLLAQSLSCKATTLYGVGSWADSDDQYIRGFVEGSYQGSSFLQLAPDFSGAPSTAAQPRLVNLATDAGTHRVVRIYRGTAVNTYELTDRLDFAKSPRELRWEALQDLPGTIRYVLVKDHGNHVVTDDLIERVCSRVGDDAEWFVATKQWNPPWLKKLKRRRLKCVLFQETAAKQASTGELHAPGVGSWFIENCFPTRRALLAINNVLNEFKDSPQPAVVVTPLPASVLAYLPDMSPDKKGYVLCDQDQDLYQTFVPRGSALLASMFFAYYNRQEKHNWATHVSSALDFTSRWMVAESARFREPSRHDNTVVLSSSDKLEKTISEKARLFAWDREVDEYRQAFDCWLPERRRGYGVIQREDGLYLELWRAQSEVPQMISIDRARRSLLAQLSQEFGRFVLAAKRRRATNKSFLIVDSPGTGKSTSVRQLAQDKNLRMLSVNITELTRRTDLLSFFDTIVTTQAQEPDVPLVVFVDEVNALLEGQTVYGSFLAPLEDGRYVRDGKVFRIRPCIWMFVGTDARGTAGKDLPIPEVGQSLAALINAEVKAVYPNADDNPESDAPHRNDERERRDQEQKKTDFMSRLTTPPFVLNQPFARPEDRGGADEEIRKLAVQLNNKSERDRLMAASKTDDGPRNIARLLLKNRLLREGQALERVYVVSAMIQRLHPFVDKISLRVLAALALLQDTVTLRELRHDVGRMKNIHRTVHWGDMPYSFRKRLGYFRIDSHGSPTDPSRIRFGVRVPNVVDTVEALTDTCIPDGTLVQIVRDLAQ